MASIQVDGYEFNFPKARELYKFDEQDKGKPYFHGVSHALKAVDVMVELATQYLFIEIKRFDSGFVNDGKEDAGKQLINSLVIKFRDAFVYRYCEEKLDKPIAYICLIDKLDSAMMQTLQRQVALKIPVGIPKGCRWKRPLLERCFVVNEQSWMTSDLAKLGHCRYVGFAVRP